MNKTQHHVLVLAVLCTACGDSEPPRNIIDAAEMSRPAGGGPAPTPARKPMWSGIETCSGSSAELKSIDKTSEQTSIADFVKTTTRASLVGIDVGPTPEYSCDQLSFDAVVTSTTGRDVHFESASDEPLRQSLCASATGKPLLVGWLDGYDLDLRQLGGPWTLKFQLRITEPIDPEADPLDALRRADIRCQFELELK